MKSLIFPDVNLWLALNYGDHSHNRAAVRWYLTPDLPRPLVFNRHTQLGLFRLLSTEAVLGQNALSVIQCWKVFDRWIDSDEAILVPEPSDLDQLMRAHTQAGSISPKVWADAYLAAFAESGGFTLVTFDKALAAKARGAMLLA
jgi:hypothetical protein